MQRIALIAALALVATTANAQPVKCVDEKGKTRYIDQSMMAQEKCAPVKASTQYVPMQPGAIAPRPPAAQPDNSASGAAVAQAEKNLADARKKLADQEAVRTGDERNYARVEERLKPYQTAVESAEKALEQARRSR